jgi:hypothetical protein
LQVSIYEALRIDNYLCGNDDAIVCVTRKKKRDEKIQRWDSDFTTSLGLIVSSKSYSSYTGCIFEEYSTKKLNDKSILYECALVYSLFGVNLTNKRYLFSSVMNSFNQYKLRERDRYFVSLLKLPGMDCQAGKDADVPFSLGGLLPDVDEDGICVLLKYK